MKMYVVKDLTLDALAAFQITLQRMKFNFDNDYDFDLDIMTEFTNKYRTLDSSVTRREYEIADYPCTSVSFTMDSIREPIQK